MPEFITAYGGLLITLVIAGGVVSLILKIVKFILFFIANRCFGWMPSIYKEEIAEEIANQALEVYLRENEHSMGFPIDERVKVRLADLAFCAIQCYTYNYALLK